MSGSLILGEPVAAALRAEALAIARDVKNKTGRAPVLTIVASADESARIYAQRICKDAAACEIDARVEPLDLHISHDDAARRIAAIAADSGVDAILLQTPLPKAVDAARIADLLPPWKDVDGASLVSAGAAALGRENAFFPATAAAVLELLKRSNVNISGERAIVLGRSAVVGRPAAFGLLTLNATVTIAHSKTREIDQLTKEAGIVIAAIGKLGLITPEWIRPGATVIDVGIHRVTDPAVAAQLFHHEPARLAAFQQKGSAVAGDCHPDVARVAGAFTPVPGGVGPVTSAILLKQSAQAALLSKPGR